MSGDVLRNGQRVALKPLPTRRRVIAFVFAGRKGNMELQLPMMRRILADHPNVEYHVWNLTQCPADDEYVRNDISGDRITVFSQLWADELPWRTFNDVYRHYASSQFQDCLFVKLDDDVVFVETDRFGDFVEAIDSHRGAVVSAKVVNNGACTRTEPGLWDGYEALDIPLLDVHLSAEYADMAHNYFLEHANDMVGQPLEVIGTDDWLSINLIGYDWNTGRRIASLVGKPTAPQTISGRSYEEVFRIGDEGTVNLLPRFVVQGFTACHLYFGPQRRLWTDDHIDELRGRYAAAVANYLGDDAYLHIGTDAMFAEERTYVH